MDIIKEKKKEKNINTNKLINGLKCLWLYLKTIFWVFFICLTLGFGGLLLGSDEPYKNDDDQMRVWMEKEATRKRIYEMEDI